MVKIHDVYKEEKIKIHQDENNYIEYWNSEKPSLLHSPELFPSSGNTQTCPITSFRQFFQRLFCFSVSPKRTCSLKCSILKNNNLGFPKRNLELVWRLLHHPELETRVLESRFGALYKISYIRYNFFHHDEFLFSLFCIHHDWSCMHTW